MAMMGPIKTFGDNIEYARYTIDVRKIVSVTNGHLITPGRASSFVLKIELANKSIEITCKDQNAGYEALTEISEYWQTFVNATWNDK